MCNLSDFEIGQVVGAILGFVIKTAELFNSLSSAVSKFITSAKRNNGLNRKLIDKVRRTFKIIVARQHKTIPTKSTPEFDKELDKAFMESFVFGRAAILKPL